VNYARFLFGTVSLSLNLWLQSMILYYVNTYIVPLGCDFFRMIFADFLGGQFRREGTQLGKKPFHFYFRKNLLGLFFSVGGFC